MTYGKHDFLEIGHELVRKTEQSAQLPNTHEHYAWENTQTFQRSMSPKSMILPNYGHYNLHYPTRTVRFTGT